MSFEHWNQFVTETIETMKQNKLPDDEQHSRDRAELAKAIEDALPEQ